MPMDLKRYPPDWKAISLRIRKERAGDVCEWCGAVAGKPHPITGSKVVLSVHHIGVDKPDGTPGDPHDKMDCREENLAALCQRCHFKADLELHIVSARISRNRNKHRRIIEAGQQPLFE
jgi:hypothetical protein